MTLPRPRPYAQPAASSSTAMPPATHTDEHSGAGPPRPRRRASSSTAGEWPAATPYRDPGCPDATSNNPLTEERAKASMEAASKRPRRDGLPGGLIGSPARSISSCTTELLEDSWCIECWTSARDECHEEHKLVRLSVAEEDASVAFQVARNKLAKLEARLAKVQAERERRHSTLLEATVPRAECKGWVVEGGTFRMALTASLSDTLTRKEKDDLCEALTGGDLDYRWNEVQGVVDRELLAGVYDKLPERVVGQRLPRGTALLSPRSADRLDLTVHLEGVRAELGRGARVLGRVAYNRDALVATECSGQSSGSKDCFCRSRNAGTVRLAAVYFPRLPPPP